MAPLLDHILIYKGSNMGNSHRHAHIKVPVILLGGIDGKFQGNRHIVFPTTRSGHRTCCSRCCTSTTSKTFRNTTRRTSGYWNSEIVRLQHQAVVALAMRKLIVLGILAALPAAAQVGGRATRPKIERPDGAVWNVIRTNCTLCHGIDDYAFYALDKTGWTKVIADKHKPGDIALKEADRALLVDWLATRFGPETKAISAHLYSARGHDVLLRSRGDTPDEPFVHKLPRYGARCKAPEAGRGMASDTSGYAGTWRQLNDEELERLVEWLDRVWGTNQDK